jgi:DNA-binding NarL/FixJ family response regulator
MARERIKNRRINAKKSSVIPAHYDPGQQAKALSVREREILDLIGCGRTSKEIASVLGLSPATIATYRKHICRKLNLHSTPQLATFAMQVP